jgi:hypothetical protein
MSAVSSPSPSVRRLAILLGVMLATLSLAFMLPRSEVAREAAVRMELPENLTFWARGGDGGPVFQYWHGAPLPVSEEEHRMLANDTEFAKKRYVLSDVDTKKALIQDPRLAHFGELLAVQASIVLSGHDLNESIHRPERCLPAQGFKELRLEPRKLKTSRGEVPVTRIRCYTEIKDPATGQFVLGADGRPVRLQHVFYYWFVGSHTITADHYDRTLTDMRDRLLGGFDQRWAYVLLGSSYTDYLFSPEAAAALSSTQVIRSEAQTDALLAEVISAISGTSLLWDRVKP